MVSFSDIVQLIDFHTIYAQVPSLPPTFQFHIVKMEKAVYVKGCVLDSIVKYLGYKQPFIYITFGRCPYTE